MISGVRESIQRNGTKWHISGTKINTWMNSLFIYNELEQTFKIILKAENKNNNLILSQKRKYKR